MATFVFLMLIWQFRVLIMRNNKLSFLLYQTIEDIQICQRNATVTLSYNDVMLFAMMWHLIGFARVDATLTNHIRYKTMENNKSLKNVAILSGVDELWKGDNWLHPYCKSLYNQSSNRVPFEGITEAFKHLDQSKFANKTLSWKSRHFNADIKICYLFIAGAIVNVCHFREHLLL